VEKMYKKQHIFFLIKNCSMIKVRIFRKLSKHFCLINNRIEEKEY